MLARAAALVAPLPLSAPTRSPAQSAAKSAPNDVIAVSAPQRFDGAGQNGRTPPMRPPSPPRRGSLALLFGERFSAPKPANPYGDLVYDAFTRVRAPRRSPG